MWKGARDHTLTCSNRERVLRLELPRPPTYWALGIFLLAFGPTFDAMNVERVTAFSRYNWTILTRDAAMWTASLELLAANAARVISTVPPPSRYKVRARYFNLHKESPCLYRRSFTR
ncbi:hypothetical protein TRVL_00890 [Trypanosoma vivax]|uniref:Uncharacterized protein n=1 Tax=Trypanosoma vivax (strain Y486) TaxID=1055687 RepID=G0U2X6_TRYVY|nr:hypothetical protein TRVL_00890 [Trypanosoma vivax]CCC50630.1 hypothetical protein, unlikely [Trypanosoma vivax Y486]